MLVFRGLPDRAEHGSVLTIGNFDGVHRGHQARSPAVLQRFESARRGDINGRSMVIDLVNRSLLSDLLPVQAARAFGLHLLSGVGVLRRLAMREGLAMAWRPGRR